MSYRARKRIILRMKGNPDEKEQKIEKEKTKNKKQKIKKIKFKNKISKIKWAVVQKKKIIKMIIY